jgi:hypothetical protein
MRFESLCYFTDLLDYETVLVHDPSNKNLSVLGFVRFDYQKMSEIWVT